MAQLAQSGFSTKNWHPESADAPVLFERYQILGILGEGGMGTVFKGYHLNLKRHVAIKTLRVDHRHSADMASRFLKEMESVGQMDHPNVVRATDGGEKNGVFYLVMEYLPGSDLARLTSRKGRLDVAAACELIQQAALGLDYIHQKALIHRDIKPSNLMLTTAGLVKILDLGLARLSIGESVDQDHTPTGVAVGTYAYMAPEQADAAADIDGRADLYSLGCTLFKLLTGHAPYSGREYDSAAKVLYAHRHVPLASIASFATIPLPMRDVVEKMMAKDPGERYQTGKEVAAALAPFIPAAAPSLPRGFGTGGETTDETPLQPLPWPLPSEISRLTDSPKETPVDTPSVLSTHALAPVRRRPWHRWAAAACLTACVLGPLLWIVAPVLFRELPPAAGVHDLDALTPRHAHHLLRQKPFALNRELENARLCRWDGSAEAVDVTGSGKLLFLLGKTTRPRFTFEADISQAPWTGDLGIFWGYHENETLKADDKHRQDGSNGPEFGWFQMLRFEVKHRDNQGDAFFVSRYKGSVRHNKLGELATNMGICEASQPVDRPRNNLANLKIEIVDGRAKLAFFNGLFLRDLYSPETNLTYPPEPADGALGLIAVRNTGSFRNARFIIHANK